MRLLLIILSVILMSGCVTQATYRDSNKPLKEQDINKQEIAKTRISLGLAYLQKQQMSQAKYNFEKALKFAPQMPEVHYSLGYYYQLVGNLSRAESSYKKALKIDPNNADALNNFGVFLCSQGKFSSAKEYYLKALKQTDYIRAAETYENMGLCALESKQKDEAVGYLESALNHDPNRRKSLYALTEHFINLEQTESASRYLANLMKLTPLTADSIWLAYRIAKLQRQPQVAENWLQQMLNSFPDSPRSRAYLEKKIND